MQLHGMKRVALLVLCGLFNVGYQQSNEPLPNTLLGGIGNVASSATNFLNSAVERPRNLLINATRATTGYIDSAASRGLESKLRRLLEKFRSRTLTGIPEFGIPVLDPFRLHRVNIVIDNPEIGNLTLVVKDLVVRRISTFTIDRIEPRLSFSGAAVKVNISISQIHAEGFYNISGVIGNMMSIYGAGPFNATIHDFRCYVYTVLGFSRGMYMKQFDLDFSLHSLELNLENFMGGGDMGHVMNQVFQDIAPEALEIIKPDILPGIQNYIASTANETIRHLNVRDIVTVLGQNEIRDVAHLLIPSGPSWN